MNDIIPRCQAEIKPPMATRSHKCLAPSLPGENLCPLHLVLAKGVTERFEKSMPRRLMKALQKQLMKALEEERKCY